VKGLLKSANNWRRHGEKFGIARFYGPRCISVLTSRCLVKTCWRHNQIIFMILFLSKIIVRIWQ